MKIINKILKFLIIVSLIMLAISYFKKNDLPLPSQILPELMIDPIQTSTDKQPFSYQFKNVSYKVSPQYNYDLYGLVVSQNDNDVWYSRFKESDPANTKDFCVIWGQNLETDFYQKTKFRTVEFVCHIYFPNDDLVRKSYSGAHLSNNHLYAANEADFQAIRQVSIGDQIHLRGYLANLESIDPEGRKWTRSTSVSRTDSDCETIYVEQFEILKKGNVLWHQIFKIMPYVIIIICFLLILIFIISTNLINRSRSKDLPEMPNKDILLPKK